MGNDHNNLVSWHPSHMWFHIWLEGNLKEEEVVHEAKKD